MQCYHLTNQNVFEGSSIALSDLLLINAVPLWDSVEAEMVEEAERAHSHTHTRLYLHTFMLTHKEERHANSHIPQCHYM